jgi:hypothetical protein
MAGSEAPRASTRGICGKAKRNCAEATRLRPAAASRSPLAIPPRASARGILAKASEPVPSGVDADNERDDLLAE